MVIPDGGAVEYADAAVPGLADRAQRSRAGWALGGRERPPGIRYSVAVAASAASRSAASFWERMASARGGAFMPITTSAISM